MRFEAAKLGFMALVLGVVCSCATPTTAPAFGPPSLRRADRARLAERNDIGPPNIVRARLPAQAREGDPIWATIIIEWDQPFPPPLNGIAGDLILRGSALDAEIVDDWGEIQLSRCPYNTRRAGVPKTDGLRVTVRKRLDRCFVLPEGRYWVSVFFRRPEYSFTPRYSPIEVLPRTARRCLDPFGARTSDDRPGTRCAPGSSSRLSVRLASAIAGRQRGIHWRIAQRYAVPPSVGKRDAAESAWSADHQGR